MSARARRLLPLVVALSALSFVLARTDLLRLRMALAHAPLGEFVIVSLLFMVLNCAADTLAMYYVFRWFGLALRYIDLYTIRAATYTLAVINYHAGQLGIIGFIHRVSRVPLSRASGYVLFIVGVWVGLLLLIASLGAIFGGAKGRALLPVLLLFGAGMVVYVTLLLWQPPWLKAHLVVPDQGGRLRRMCVRVVQIGLSILSPLLRAGVRGHVRALIVRLPHLGVLILWHFYALSAFQIQVPFHLALLYLPVVFAVASLPISVQGLGTSQMAAVYFFRDFSSGGEADVLAYSLSMTAISTVSSLMMGFLFLRRGARLGLAGATEDITKDEGEEEPGTALAKIAS